MKKKDKLQLRCSSLPLFMSCSASEINPDDLLRVSVEYEQATLGTCIHECCEDYMMTGKYSLDTVKTRFDDTQYRYALQCMHNAVDIIDELRKHFIKPKCEQTVTAETKHTCLTGHIDLWDRAINKSKFVDYKTGRLRSNYYHQMAGYALGIWTAASKPSKYQIYCAIIFLEDNEIVNYTFTVKDLKRWVKQLDDKAQNVKYTTNTECYNCDLSNSCPAFYLIKQEAHHVLGIHVASIRELDKEERALAVQQIRILEKDVKFVKAQLRRDVEHHGPILIGDNKEYALRDSKHPVIIMDTAFSILLEYIPQEYLMRSLSANINALEELAFSMASKGQGTKTRHELRERLEREGGLVYARTKKLMLTTKKKQDDVRP